MAGIPGLLKEDVPMALSRLPIQPERQHRRLLQALGAHGVMPRSPCPAAQYCFGQAFHAEFKTMLAARKDAYVKPIREGSLHCHGCSLLYAHHDVSERRMIPFQAPHDMR